MAIISLRDVALAFGAAPLLDGVTWHVEEHERVCLLGRNGAGKSTLLSLLSGRLEPDEGVVERRNGVRVARLAQEVPRDASGTVRDVVAAGLAGDPTVRPDDVPRRVEKIVSRVDLSPDVPVGPLSAGNKRRVLLARALVQEPDVLLLDEPTNHLDIPAIMWLEDFLLRWGGTTVFVSHDRRFLSRVATRVVELDRGQLFGFPGSYPSFVRRREEALAAEEAADARRDKKLAEEEAWIRRGIKARGVRNMGRVRALERLRRERKARRDRVGRAQMSIQQAATSGKLVLEAEGVVAGYGDRRIVEDFSTFVLRGDRVAIVGPNGCGKTTLLKTLLGALPPQAGRVRVGARVEVAYFDQLREQLDPTQTVADNVADGGEYVTQSGRRRHVIGYLEDFLFPPARAGCPIDALSGGERNRLLLAKLFLKPSNLLVLDEPTNDLDTDTLELLETQLIDFPGTVIVVSHDRAFVDNVATSTIAYVRAGRFVEHAGGYTDWVASERAGDLAPPPGGPTTDAPSGDAPPTPETATPRGRRAKPKSSGPRRLNNKETRELEQLPAVIEALEAEQTALQGRMGDPSFYRNTAGEDVAAATARLAVLEGELEAAYGRWQELDERTS
ncbi:MAG: ATP-binding cassette domain-containing protein [Myxococcota bacterium]